MAIFKLPKGLQNSIKQRVGDLFDKVKGQFLGPKGLGSALIFKFDRNLSLPGMYEAATRDEGATPNTETLDTLVGTSKMYLDALKHRATNQVLKDIESHLSQEDSTPESIEQAIGESWEKVTDNVKTILEAETQTTKNVGVLEGIVQANASTGNDDPLVCFIPSKDQFVCEECIKVHVMPDGVTPRVFRVSEIDNGYHRKGTMTPSIHGLHPNCRCQMTTVLPGYGFNTAGRITYKSKDYNVYTDQHS